MRVALVTTNRTPLLVYAAPAGEPKPPKSDSPWMDKHGWTQDRLNANALSHWDAASPQTQAEAHHWYPAAHDWANEMSARNGWHPDKGYATVAAFSPLRRWDGNLQDAHNFMTHYPHSPENVKRPSGLSSGENLKRAQRVHDAPDDPTAIRQALWGKAGERGAKKITNFHDNMRDPSDPNPVTIDSWMPRGILWGHGEEPNWPEELNKGLPITKKKNPETGAWESPGLRPPTPRDIGLQALGKAGAYDRMANAVRYVAQQRGLPAAHVAQAGIWNKLGGTANPDGDQIPQHPAGPLTHIQDPHALYQAVWQRQQQPKSAGFFWASGPEFFIDDHYDDADGSMKAIDIAFHHGHVPHTEVLAPVEDTDEQHGPRTGALTPEDMENLQWDWGKGKWVPRSNPDDPMIPPQRKREFDYDRDWPGWRGSNQVGGSDPALYHQLGDFARRDLEENGLGHTPGDTTFGVPHEAYIDEAPWLNAVYDDDLDDDDEDGTPVLPPRRR